MMLVRVRHGAMHFHLPGMTGPVEVVADGVAYTCPGAGPNYCLLPALWAALPQPPRGLTTTIAMRRAGESAPFARLQIHRRKWSQ